MNRILSQDEVDALLGGLCSGSNDTEYSLCDDPNTIVSFDLKNQDRIIRGRWPVLEIINDIIGVKVSKRLSEQFGTDIELYPISIDLKKYGEFLRTLTQPTSIYVNHSNTLNDCILNVMDLRFTLNLLEMGLGREISNQYKLNALYKESRKLTPCEDNIMDEAHKVILECQNEAWGSIFNLDLIHKEKSSKPQYTTTYPSISSVVIITFEVEICEKIGTFVICIPYQMLEPISHLLKNQYTSEESITNNNIIKIDKNTVNSIKSDIRFYKKGTSVNLKELSALKVDDFIPFKDDKVEASILNKVKFYGTLNDNGECLLTDILRDKQNTISPQNYKKPKKTFLNKLIESVNKFYYKYNNTKYFNFLKNIDPELTIIYLEKEQPQLIAVIIYHLIYNKNKLYYKLLLQMKPELREDILKRVKNIKNPSEYITKIVHNTLKEEIKKFKSKKYIHFNRNIMETLDKINDYLESMCDYKPQLSEDKENGK